MGDTVEPQPEDFGISREVVERTPPPFMASHPAAIVLSVVATVAIAGFLLAWQRSGSAAGAVFFTCVLVGASLVVLVPAAWLLVCAAGCAEDRLRARRDPLWRACQAYRTALETSRSRGERRVAEPEGEAAGRWRRLDRPALCRAVADRLTGEGWTVQHVADHEHAGADLVAERDGRRMVVWCEPGPAPVGLSEARQLAAARLERSADEALLVCPGGALPDVHKLMTVHSLRIAGSSDLASIPD